MLGNVISGFNPEVTDIPSHPSNEALYDNQTGPTPVEAPYPVDPEPTVSISGVAPIGFEAQGMQTYQYIYFCYLG